MAYECRAMKGVKWVKCRCVLPNADTYTPMQRRELWWDVTKRDVARNHKHRRGERETI